MTSPQKSHGSFPAVGGSSLLVIFAVLCLTIFALLSLSTVLSGQRLGSASAQAVRAYYEADCAAEEILAALRSGELPSGVSVSGHVYSYECPISETQALQVEVELSGSDYRILCWQAVSTLDWQTDESLNLWDGSSDPES